MKQLRLGQRATEGLSLQLIRVYFSLKRLVITQGLGLDQRFMTEEADKHRRGSSLYTQRNINIHVAARSCILEIDSERF